MVPHRSRRRSGGFKSLARVGLAALALSSVTSARAFAGDAAPPNIVLITSDDQNFRDYGFTGSGSVLDSQGNPIRPFTPTLDAWFQNGVTYAMGRCPIAVCRPSLASIFTGLNPVQSGTYGNDPVVNGSALGWGQNQDNPYNDILRRNVEFNATLPRILSEMGYLALQTGKWWEGDPKRGGFTHAEPAYATTNADRHLHNYLDNGAGSIGRAAGSVTARVGAFIDESIAKRQPFFVSYAPFLPHGPFNAPASYVNRYTADINAGRITSQQASYLACVDWFDATLTELKTLLQSKGVYANTLIVYVADNGWIMPRSGTVPSYGGNGGKMTPFENGVRTPIFFFQEGRVSDARPLNEKLADPRLASSTDIMPTLLRRVGAQIPQTLQGVDLLASHAAAARKRVFGDTYLHDQQVLVNSQYRVGNPEATLTSRWMIEDNWKLILVTRNPTGQSIGASTQLYNLATDPLETSNLATQHAARAAAMTVTLNEWWNRTRPRYLYDHEFNGSATTLNQLAPDVLDSSLSTARWASAGTVLNNGSMSGLATAQLPFSPRSSTRFELRAALKPSVTTSEGVALGFLNADAASAGPADNMLAGARITKSASGTLTIDLLARDDGTAANSPVFSFAGLQPADVHAVAIVLDSSDNDPFTPGPQWAVDLMVNGVRRYRHAFAANPAIAHIGFGGLGSSATATINHLALVEIPLFPAAATGAIVDADLNADGRIDIEDLYLLNQNLNRDVNRDGAIDTTDIAALDHYLQSQR